AREAQGISLRALARKLYRSHSTLVEYERGHRLAPLEVVEAYESELGAPSGTLAALHVLACFQLYGEDRSHRKTYVLRSLPFPGTEGGTSPISFRRRLKSFSVQGPRLVGRAHELEVLESELGVAAQGGFRCVLVTSEPGVGKSRLITELLARHAEEA